MGAVVPRGLGVVRPELLGDFGEGEDFEEGFEEDFGDVSDPFSPPPPVRSRFACENNPPPPPSFFASSRACSPARCA